MNPPSLPHRSQRGVTLIVALIMLVVIGFMSASIMRGALSGDTVANNLRVQNFAMQQAQIGLRYCESMIAATQADRDAAGVIIPGAPPADDASYQWKAFASWHGGDAVADEVPEDWYAGGDASITVSQAPQCLIERMRGQPMFYVVTARGFSPDYTEDDAGRTASGSVVWLQSIVAL